MDSIRRSVRPPTIPYTDHGNTDFLTRMTAEEFEGILTGVEVRTMTSHRSGAVNAGGTPAGAWTVT